MAGAVEAAERRLCDFILQDLANTAWAYAMASQSDAQLFTTLARAAELNLGDFNMQDLANIAWGFATASHSDAQLFAVLAWAAEQRLGDFHYFGWSCLNDWR